MKSAVETLQDRISKEFLPSFCKNPNPDLSWRSPDCFKPDWSKIHEVDAADCLRSIDGGLVTQIGFGQYQDARSAHKEQFFWSLPPTRIILWVEPIIAVAVLARLHFVLGWPKHSLGTETSDGKFDAAVYIAAESHVEYIACEVKKSNADLEQLIELMIRFGESPSDKPAHKEENAFKKIQALRSRRPPLFWAVGPAGSNYAFRMGYADDGSVRFDAIPTQELSYQAAIGRKMT